MRTIGVVPELGVAPGLYYRSSLKPAMVHSTWLDFSRKALTVKDYAKLVLAFHPLGVFYHLLFSETKPIIKLENAQPIPQSNDYLISLNESVTLQPRSLDGVYSDYADKIFHGLFNSEKLLRASMGAFGGHGHIQIVSQETANKYLKKAGGSSFTPGLYIPHPKDHSLLLPLNGYDDEIKAEIKSETHEILALLKAKSVLFAQKVSHEVKANAQTKNPTGGYKAQLEAKYGESNTSELKFSKPSFQPQEALKDRLWLGDNREIKSLVQNLIKTHPESYEVHSQIDIALEGALDVLNVASASKTTGNIKYKGKLEFTFRAEFFEWDA